MELSKEVADEVLQARIDDLVPNKCCTLVYTVSFTRFLIFIFGFAFFIGSCETSYFILYCRTFCKFNLSY